MKANWLSAILVAHSAYGQVELYPVAQNGKWGLVAGNQKVVLEPVYDYVEFEPNAKKFIYYQDNKKGLIAQDGQILSQPIYEDIVFFDSVYYCYKSDGLWGLVSGENLILPFVFESITKISTELFLVRNKDIQMAIGSRIFHPRSSAFFGTRVTDVTTVGLLSIVSDSSGKFVWSDSESVILMKNVTELEECGKTFSILRTADSALLVNRETGTFVGPRGIGIKALGSERFLIDTGGGYYRIYFGKTGKYYRAPKMDTILSEDFPEMIYLKDGLTGAWNLEKGAQILDPKYDGILKEGRYYYLIRDGYYGVATGTGTILLKPEYDNIDNYENFFVATATTGKGIYSRYGKCLEPCVYKDIRVYDDKVKCLNNSELVVLDFDASGSLRERTKYSEFVTMTFVKERVPQQKSENIRFGSPSADFGRADRFGWFRPDIEVPAGDSVKIVKGRWGLKDETDSIHILPKYAHVISNEKSGFTKAYGSKPYFGDYGSGGINNSYINVPLGEKFTAVFNSDFVLVDHMAKKIANKDKFVYANLDDLSRYNQCLAFTKRMCLINRKAEVVMDSLGYCSEYSENIMAVNQGGKITFERNHFGAQCNASEYLIAIDALNWYQYNLFVHVSGGNWYYLNSAGKRLNDLPFEAAEPFRNNRAIVCKNGLWGVVDSAMKEIVPFEFASIERIEQWTDGTVETWFKVNKRTGERYVYNKYSGTLEKSEVFALKDYFDGHWFMQMAQGGNWALVDTALRPLTGFDFTHVKPFEDGYACVVQMGRRSLIDREGNLILPWYKAKDIEYLGHGRYAVSEKSGVMIVLSNGDTVVKGTQCDEIVASSENYVVFRNSNSQQFITDNEHTVKLPKDAHLISYSLDEDLVLLQNGSRRQIFNLKLEKFISKDAGGAYQLGQSSVIFKLPSKKYGIVSLTGDTLVKPVYDEIFPMKNGWTFAKKGKRYVIIDRSGKQLDTMEISRFRTMGENYLVQCKGGLGLIGIYAGWIIRPKYVSIEVYNSSFYKAGYENGQVDLYDLSGQLLVGKPFDDVKGIHPEGLIVHDRGFDYLWTGFLNPSLSFQLITPVSATSYILSEYQKSGVYDNEGKQIVPVLYHKVDPVQDAFQVRFFNSFGFYNRDGSVVFDPVR